MVKHTRYENKKVLVLGLALSGFHAAKLLHELGAMVTVNDSKELADNPDAQELIASGIRVISGYHPVDFWMSRLLILLRTREFLIQMKWFNVH